MTLKPIIHRIKPVRERLPRRKPVTIGIGFLCPNSVVICADTQMSNGYMKFYETKIYPFALRTSKGEHCGVAITFAGNPSLMKAFYDRFKNEVNAPSFNASMATVEEKLKEVLEGMGNSLFDAQGNPDLYLLCGMVSEGKPVLLKTQAQTVHHVRQRYDFVGSGDSSVLRYLARILQPEFVDNPEAAIRLGTYLVGQAKIYADGCGGDTDIMLISQHGALLDVGTTTYFTEKDMSLIERFLMGVFLVAREKPFREASFDGLAKDFVEHLKTSSQKDIFEDL